MPVAIFFIALLLCSLLFAIVFILCSRGALKLLLKDLNVIFPGGGSSWSPYEVVVFGLYAAGVLASFLIHPYGAYLIGGTIRQLASSENLQTFIAIFFGSFQLTLLAGTYGAFSIRNYVDRQNREGIGRAHSELVLALKRADIDVTATSARIIADDGKFILAEVTLQISNVPLSLPYYELNIHDVGSDERFFTAVVRQTNHSITNPYLKVSRQDDGWLFFDIFTKRVVSDDHQRVVLRFELSRVKASRNELPDTITPRLGIWARDDKVYTTDHIFFYKPIPIAFRHG